MEIKKIPHFYKLRLRLGMPHPPIHHTQMNLGVEDGPEAVLTEKFLSSFPGSAVDVFNFSLPENVSKKQYEDELVRSSFAYRDFISATLQSDEIQIAVGGDHSMTFYTLLDILSRKTDLDTIGYIQFDSHGDMNLQRESLTDNFHGMYLRAFLDVDFDMLKIKALIPQLFPPENILFIGNLDLDMTGEKQYFEARHIQHISKDDLRKRPAEMMKRFETFVRQFRYLHVTFDIDALDQSIAPATGIPAEEGLLWDDIYDMLCVIAKQPDFSFDLAEVNPHKSGAKQTIRIAQKIIETILRTES